MPIDFDPNPLRANLATKFVRRPVAGIQATAAFRTLVIGAITAGIAWAQGSQPPENPENGKAIYIKDGCYECHGSAGQGGTGPRLGPKPMAAAAFQAYVRKPAGVMPRYSAKILSDKELSDIHAYLVTVPEPPPVKTLRPLNH